MDGAYWNDVAERMARNNFLPEAINRFRAFALLDLLRLWCPAAFDGARLLKTDAYEEAFFSTGFLLELAPLRTEVIGIDISSAIVERARCNAARRRLDCRFVACDVRQLTFASDSFDVIVSHSTLDHFPDEDDLLVSLAELRRVLRPGGMLLLTLDNRRNVGDPLVRLARRLSPFYVSRGFLAAEAKEALRRTGFEVADSRYLAHSVRIVDIVAARAVNRLGRGRLQGAFETALRRFDSLCKGAAFGSFFGTYVAVKAVKA